MPVERLLAAGPNVVRTTAIVARTMEGHAVVASQFAIVARVITIGPRLGVRNRPGARGARAITVGGFLRFFRVTVLAATKRSSRQPVHPCSGSVAATAEVLYGACWCGSNDGSTRSDYEPLTMPGDGAPSARFGDAYWVLSLC